MEHKEELPLEKKSSHEEAVVASSWHPLSLLRHVAHSCAGYLGLSRLCHALKELKPHTTTSAPPAAISSKLQQEAASGGIEHATIDDCMAVEVQSRGVPQRPHGLREGRGGTHH